MTERSESGVEVYIDVYIGIEEDSTIEKEGEEGFLDISTEIDVETRRIIEEDKLGRSTTEYKG